jgi:hypothetical protein
MIIGKRYALAAVPVHLGDVFRRAQCFAIKRAAARSRLRLRQQERIVEVVKFGLLVFLMLLPLHAQWHRHVITAKGTERDDTPAPHPLSYFTRYPFLRDEDSDACYGCSQEERFNWAKQQKGRAEVRYVGDIRRFAIFDVFYYIGDADSPDWKSVLVRTAPGRYHEIWHYQRIEGGIWPSFPLKLGNETLLGIHDNCYKQDVIQEYYWFSEVGARRIDFSPIWQAAQRAVPPGNRVVKIYDGRTDIPRGRFRVGLIRDPDWRCCSQGVVEVQFELKLGQVTVSGARFEPDAQFYWGRGCR